MRTIFVFAYYSYKDPVFQSAVLPYLKMVKQKGLRFVLLTWEQKEYQLTSSEVSQFEEDLQNDHIIWHRTQWHSGRLKLLKKVYDFTKGLFVSLYFIIKYKVHKIYSEGFPGAVIGHYLSKITGRKHIIHTFEPHADYMREAGVWSSKSWEYRLLKKLEIPIANQCEHIITATDAYKEELIERGATSNIWTIPSCIDFNQYQFNLGSRNEIRKELGISANQIVIIYVGKIGGMYMEEEIFDFFSYCLTLDEAIFEFLLLTNAEEQLIRKYCASRQIPKKKIHFLFVNKQKVPGYLSAADIGFCGIRPIPSRKYSSPIKNGEYWACGLPVLIPVGIAKDDLLAERHHIGKAFVDITELSRNVITSLTLLDRTKIRKKTVSLRDIHQFKDIFQRVFGN